jgi:excisionase family DNA binding protein
MLEEWLTVRRVAEYLRLTGPTVTEYVRLGKLPVSVRGRIKRGDLEAFLEAGRLGWTTMKRTKTDGV